MRGSWVLLVGLLTSPAWAKGLPPLPDKIELHVDARSAGALHARALENFREAFAPDRLEAMLADLAQGSKSIKGHTRTQLKDMRKQGVILRSAYVSLDARHEAPKALDSFVRVFGKLNDAIDNKMGDEIARQAQRMQKLLGQDKLARLDGALQGFRPASGAEFDRYVADAVKVLAGAVDHDELPAKEFHEVRKSLKNLLAVAQLLEDSSTETDQSHALYKHLFELNEQLGKAHDRLVRRDLRGKANYNRATIGVPDWLKASVTRLNEDLGERP